jgi:hypothetical protein
MTPLQSGYDSGTPRRLMTNPHIAALLQKSQTLAYG